MYSLRDYDKPAFNTIINIDVCGTPTNIVYHKFVNKICLFVTQYGRINNVFVALPNVENGVTKSEYKELVHQFGTDTDEIQSAIRYLLAKVPALSDSPMEIVINLGLKEINRSVLKSLEQALCQII